MYSVRVARYCKTVFHGIRHLQNIRIYIYMLYIYSTGRDQYWFKTVYSIEEVGIHAIWHLLEFAMLHFFLGFLVCLETRDPTKPFLLRWVMSSGRFLVEEGCQLSIWDIHAWSHLEKHVVRVVRSQQLNSYAWWPTAHLGSALSCPAIGRSTWSTGKAPVGS